MNTLLPLAILLLQRLEYTNKAVKYFGSPHISILGSSEFKQVKQAARESTSPLCFSVDLIGEPELTNGAIKYQSSI